MRVRAPGVATIVAAALALSACTSSTEAGSTTTVLGLGSSLTSAQSSPTSAPPATAGSGTAAPTGSVAPPSVASGSIAAGPSPTPAAASAAPSTPTPAAAGSGGAVPATTAPGTAAAGATTPPAPAGASPAPAAGTVPQDGSGEAVTPEVLDVCAALPVAVASKDTGLAYTQQFPTSAAGIDECDYDNDDSTVAGLTVSVLDDSDGEVWTTVHESGVTDIAGLGDKAMWDNQNSLYAEKGTHLVQVSGDSLTQDQARALAMIVVSALP